MHLLRNRTGLTRMLILRHLFEHPKVRLREVAESIGITPQAVSSHIRTLAAQGLVEPHNGGRRVTVSGIQRLHESLRELKHAVDETIRNLPTVDSTSAIARESILPGEQVGLFMEEGVLVARPGHDSTSTGRAVTAATAGDEVLINQLNGVVTLEPGILWLLRITGEPPIRTPSAAVMSFLTSFQVDPQRVAAAGTGARVLAQKIGWNVDIEYAAARGAFHAAELGLRVALLVTPEYAVETQCLLDTLNAGKKERVPVQVLDLPVARAEMRENDPLVATAEDPASVRPR